ncbi:DUF6493 family protein [Streptomyces sp. HMX87]|uniref:DUF7825 domain-containing protein n=1 Tax=Streptomyces sp. HMX87 TaxID=3390849 RepID=UPI003A8671E9
MIARRWWADGNHPYGPNADDHFSAPHGLVDAASGLDALLATLHGGIRTSTLRTAGLRASGPGSAAGGGAGERGCPHQDLSRAFEARLWEIAHRLRTQPLPFLLSTPTWSTGLLEPDELVERLDTYGRLCARVAPADFAQALLRVRRADRAVARRAARRAAGLGTAEGAWLAAWLTAPAPVPTVSQRTPGPHVLVEYGEIPQLREAFPAPFSALGQPVSEAGQRWYCYHGRGGMAEHWLALLPELPEPVAARMLRDLSAGAVDDARGAAEVLPRLAETDGEPGEAVHLCVAYGLGARHPEDRLAAVDALLVLAARGRLDAGLLGSGLGELVRDGAVKALRLAESVRTAASTGANATIWGVLRHTLPALLAGLGTGRAAPPVRGLGDLLAVAAECAERSGARGELPHLDGAADRGGSSRLVTQARRLRTALTEEVAA